MNSERDGIQILFSLTLSMSQPLESKNNSKEEKEHLVAKEK